MVFEKSTTSKLMYGYKLFEAKNRNYHIKAELLLFAANSAIGILST